MDSVIGLGSNLGDRLASLRAAVEQLGRAFELSARSSVYETAAIGPPQPDYLNAAVRVRAPGAPEEVLPVLLAIEQRGGRVRRADERWLARTIDLDVLWGDGVVVSTPSLTVPHARLLERAFALLPLLDVAPDAVDPRTGARFPSPPHDAGVRRTTLVL